MNVTAVESATLRAVAYDESLELLRLEFRSRAVYDYFGVPAAVHEALLRAPSIGACFNEVIRGCFPCCRVCAVDSECRPEGEL
jgi:hypothetical protein